MTRKLYLENSHLYTHTTKITAIEPQENNKYLVRLEETIFHPKGGGQPSDKGTIGDVTLVEAFKDGDAFDFDVAHIIQTPSLALKVGDTVELQVDQAIREDNSKLHTAGHLIASVAQMLYSINYLKCHLYRSVGIFLTFGIPEDKLADVTKKITKNNNEMCTKIQDECNKIIQENPPITDFFDAANKRNIKIGSLDPFPCAGTHTKNISDLRSITIFKINKIKRDLKITYDVGQSPLAQQDNIEGLALTMTAI